MMSLAELREQMDSLDASMHEALREKLWLSCCRLIEGANKRESRRIGDHKNRHEAIARVIPFPSYRQKRQFHKQPNEIESTNGDSNS